MATTFAVVHNGQRHAVKLTPMQQLSQIVDSVGQKINQKLDAAACKLLYNTKQMDLTLPVRFANIPSGSTLELQSGSERQLGIRDGQPEDVQPSVSEYAAGPSSSSGHSGLQQSPRASMPSAAQPTAPDHSTPEPSIPTGTTTEPASVQLSMPGSAEAPAAPHEPARMHRSMMDTTDAPAAVSQPTAQPRSALDTAEASGTAQQTAEGSTRASIAAQQSKEADSTKHEPDTPEGMDPVGLGRPILLFRREAMAGQAGSAGNAMGDREPDDSYYEFTADDYHRMMAGQNASKSRAEAGLRTQKLREQDLRRRAAALGPVPIHVHFQNGLVLQAKFPALEELSALKQLVQKCLVPGIKSWSLYTAPPKQVIKDYSTSFYKAGLVPAANVYFSMGDSSAAAHETGEILQAEVLAIKGPPPADRGLHQSQQQRESSQSAQVKRIAQAQPGQGTTGRQHHGSAGKEGKPVPKWMKLGKK